ncbi:hypothetical protein Avbf_05986 [Armadillidium vulgare]|nr:hypothetical protein Avbf_05986 [Armadillidium vulgare]
MYIVEWERVYNAFVVLNYGLGCLSSESENENLCEHTQARSMMQRRSVCHWFVLLTSIKNYMIELFSKL